MKKIILSTALFSGLIAGGALRLVANGFEVKVVDSFGGSAAVQAFKDGKPVGSIRYRTLGRVCPIEYVAVLSDFQKMGIEQKMISVALGDMKRYKCEKTEFTIDRKKLPLWQFLGFSRQGSWWRSFFGQKEKQIIVEKNLR
jgi:GNAT superfamily N-acetyltransferase